MVHMMMQSSSQRRSKQTFHLQTWAIILNSVTLVISSPDMGYYIEQCDIGRKPESLSQIMIKRQSKKIRARNLSLDSNPSDVDSDDDRDKDFVPNSTDEASSDEFSTDFETEKYSPRSHVVHSSIQQSQCDSVRNGASDLTHESQNHSS